MTTRKQRPRLKKPSNVDRLFDDETVKRLCRQEGMSKKNREKFGAGLRRSIRRYLVDAKRLDPGEIRAAVTELAKAVAEAIGGQPSAVKIVCAALETLHPQVKDVLARNASATLVAGSGDAGLVYVGDQAIRDMIPTTNELTDPVRGAQALHSLYGLCSRSTEIAPGRKRQGDKRSRDTLKIEYAGPPVSEGRYPNTNELMLCASIVQLYLDATPLKKTPANGAPPIRHLNPDDRGPLVFLMTEVLRIVGASGHVNAKQLVRNFTERYWQEENAPEAACQQKTPTETDS